MSTPDSFDSPDGRTYSTPETAGQAATPGQADPSLGQVFWDAYSGNPLQWKHLGEGTKAAVECGAQAVRAAIAAAAPSPDVTAGRLRKVRDALSSLLDRTEGSNVLTDDERDEYRCVADAAAPAPAGDDARRYPFAQDLDGEWHRRPPGDRWTVSTEEPNARTLCGEVIHSVHVSEFQPEPDASTGSTLCECAMPYAEPQASPGREREALEDIARAIQGATDTGLPLDRDWLVGRAVYGLGQLPAGAPAVLSPHYHTADTACRDCQLETAMAENAELADEIERLREAAGDVKAAPGLARAETAAIRAAGANTARELAELRERITDLAEQVINSAKATEPSRKSQIEHELAIELRKLLEDQ